MTLPDIPEAAERRRVALEHLRKSLAPPDGVSLYLMLGDAIPTPAVVAVDRKSGALEVIDRQPGDRVVLRSSALMDERLAGQWSAGLASPVHWSQVTFILGKHLQMTKDPGFADNVLFILLER